MLAEIQAVGEGRWAFLVAPSDPVGLQMPTGASGTDFTGETCWVKGEAGITSGIN